MLILIAATIHKSQYAHFAHIQFAQVIMNFLFGHILTVLPLVGSTKKKNKIIYQRTRCARCLMYYFDDIHLSNRFTDNFTSFIVCLLSTLNQTYKESA